ncbi:MAG: General secretion pathway protein K, partial [Deltaproteobacteria bacterium]|nr:General secretion pathway protein K [Deltaproteobacteria bacterium]
MNENGSEFFKICNPQSAIRNQRGMALLMTILIVVLLSLLIMDINERSYLALTRAKNSVNSLNASYIMRSGVSAAMGFLELDAKGSAVDTLTEEWAQEITRFPVGEGTVSVHIVDEASKFNINTLVTPQGKINERSVERFGRLLRLAGLEDGFSRRVAEWLQRNREEISYSFADISELLLVPDFTIDTFKKIERYITVYTDRRNEFNININTVGREVLTALSPSLNETLVEAILEYRKEHPFKVERAGDLNQVTGLSDATLRTTFSDVLDVKSSDFTVKVEANVYDSKGELHYWFGDADSAVYWFKRANTFRANFSSRGLARIALLRQDYRGAEDYFSSLATGGPADKAESDCALAVISMHQGKIRMAQKELVRNLQSHRAKQLTRAVSLDRTYLTFLSYELHDYPAMVSYAQMRADEGKKNRSDPIYGRDLLAWAWLMSGKATKASVLLDEINHDIKGTSRSLQLVLDYATALLSYEKGDYQNSLNQFERAFQLLFPNRPPDFIYGVVLVKTGNTAKGIHELQRVAIWFPFLWGVLSIYPTTLAWPIASVKAHYWLGVAYEARGQNEQALKEFQQFLEIWKEADFDSPEMKDAKVRLQRL